MILLTVLWIIAHLISFGIWFSANGDVTYPFLLPKTIYDEDNVNWFGAIFLYIIYFVTTPLYAIGTFIYWCCIVGRK